MRRPGPAQSRRPKPLREAPVLLQAAVGQQCLQDASILRMTTLYIRDVSEEVAETLKERAAAEGKSLSAYVAAELAKIANRPTNAQIVAKLKARDRTTGPTSADIVAAVQAGRR